MEKMTKVQMFTQIRSHLTDKAEIAFIDHEIELVTKKNARRSDKPTKKQVANSELMEQIYEAMEASVPYRASDIQSLIPELKESNIQKTTALVSKMRDNVMISREVVKGIAYFTKI